MDWILKILSGPSEGAQIDLEPGQYLIGRGDNCDLVLDDEHVSDQHFQLVIDNENSTLTVLNDAVLPTLNGRLLESNEQVLDSPSVMSLSGFHFVFAKEDVNLSDIQLPSSSLDKEKQAGEESTDKDGLSSTVDDSLIGRRSKGVNHVSSQALMNRIKLAGRKVILAMATGVLVITTSAMMMTDEEPHAIHEEASVSLQQLEYELSEAGYPNVRLEKQGESIIVQGFIRNEMDKNILGELLPHKQSFDFQLRNLEQLKSAAEMSLSAHQVKTVTVEIGDENGSLKLLGSYHNKTTWKQILLSLKQDISLIDSWEDEVRISPTPEIPFLDVSSVSVGSVPYAVIRNGERIFVGNTLANGYRIEDIKLQHLLVSRGKEVVKINLRF